MQEADMTYSFLWDSEPTDEQLEALMKAVGKDIERNVANAQHRRQERFNEAVQAMRIKRQQKTNILSALQHSNTHKP